MTCKLVKTNPCSDGISVSQNYHCAKTPSVMCKGTEEEKKICPHWNVIKND